MLGFQDWGVLLAYVGTILSAVICVVYGIINWNRPREDQAQEIKEEAEWEKKDPDLSEGEQP
jgi:hypothetical protein